MSAITSTSTAYRSAHREYRLLLGLTYPLFLGGVALRRLVPHRAATEPVRSASFLAAVRARAGAVIPFAFMG